MYKLFIIEDDQSLSHIIKERLKKYHFNVMEVSNFYNVFDEYVRLQPDLILLDINLPYTDGYELCKKIRAHSNVPILMISARKEEGEQILALELGADDYLVKPFTMDMLLVKVRALLRRAYNEFPNTEQHVIKFNDLLLDLQTMSVHYGDFSHTLTKNEMNLLTVLMKNANTFIKKEDLIEAVWDDSHFIEDNTLSVNITKLRKLLAQINEAFRIETKRGVGYRLICEGLYE